MPKYLVTTRETELRFWTINAESEDQAATLIADFMEGIPVDGVGATSKKFRYPRVTDVDEVEANWKSA